MVRRRGLSFTGQEGWLSAALLHQALYPQRDTLCGLTAAMAQRLPRGRHKCHILTDSSLPWVAAAAALILHLRWRGEGLRKDWISGPVD